MRIYLPTVSTAPSTKQLKADEAAGRSKMKSFDEQSIVPYTLAAISLEDVHHSYRHDNCE